MKRFICIVCLLALLLSACAVAEQPLTFPQRYCSSGIYQLTFKTKLLYNHFVGNDWSFIYTHNGQTIKSGYTITQSLGVLSFQSIGVEIREMDLIDDIGTGTLAVALCEGGWGKAEMSVTENAGVFKGKSAAWEITCTVKLVGKC